MGRWLIVVLTIFVTSQYGVDARSSLGIINGTDAAEGEFPYMVQLYEQDQYLICSGTILSPEWILTEVDCAAYNMSKTVMYGTNELNNLTEGFPANSVKVKAWFVHPKYDTNSAGADIYDVALLQLQTPIPFSETVKAIKLAEANEALPFHSQGVLGGWGVNETGSKTAQKHLQKIDVKLLNDEECKTKLNVKPITDAYDPTHHICTEAYWKGGCDRDTGGGLIINGTQYGIMSWGYRPCGGSPSAFSRLTNPEYRNWIKEITNI